MKNRKKFQKIDRACRVSLLLALFAVFVVLPVYAATSVGITILGTPEMTYELTINSSGDGSVTAPGEGVFTYYIDDEVYIRAEADWQNYFVNWTGDTTTVADVNASITTITMTGDWEIQANFAPSPSIISPAGQVVIDLTGTLMAIGVGVLTTVLTLGAGTYMVRAGNLGGAFGVAVTGTLAVIIIETLMGAFK
jgi:hypothetical protein